jgi:hypothetical protein
MNFVDSQDFCITLVTGKEFARFPSCPKDSGNARYTGFAFSSGTGPELVLPDTDFSR